jgi:peptide/nickel transport system substrate-binding protein
MIAGLLVSALAACAAPTPEVIKEEVVVEKEVPVTVEVEKEKIVEKPVIETVVVEKEVVVEKVVTPTPGIPERGTLITRGLTSSFPENFNPLLFDVRVWLYDGLVRFDPDLKPIPDLAESWDISEDGLVYTFHLRKGVKFHDGVEMTADDVVYTAQLTLDEKVNSPYRSKFIIGGEPVKWEKVDDYTVRATLPQPSSSFLAKVSRADEIFFCILPKHILEKCEDIETCDFNLNPVGTGPYKLVEYVPDQRVVQEAHDDYFQGKPGLKRVIRLKYPNEQAALAALKAGDLDVTTLSEAANIKVAEEDPDITVYRYDSNWIMAARFNVGNPILEDVRVRRAIAHAVDRLSLVRAVISPSANVGDSPIPTGWGASPNVRKYEYDPDKAKALLDEAGWEPGSDGIRVKDGQRLSLNMPYTTGYAQADLAVGMQQYLKTVGIDLQLKQMEPATFDEAVYQNKDFDIYLGWQGFGVDPDVASRWVSETAEAGTYMANPSNYSNPELDAAFEAAELAASLEERQKHLWKAMDIIGEDCPAVWFFMWQAHMAVSKNIGGLSLPASSADMDNRAIYRENWKVTSTRP